MIKSTVCASKGIMNSSRVFLHHGGPRGFWQLLVPFLPLVLALSLELSLGCVCQPHPGEGLSRSSSLPSAPHLKAPEAVSQGDTLFGGREEKGVGSQTEPFPEGSGEAARSAPT